MKPIKGGQHPTKKNEADEMLKLMADMLKGDIGKPKPNMTGISYSGLLLQLIKPYQRTNGSIPIEELEYLLDIGMAAWNLSVYKKKNDFLYRSYLDALKSGGAMDKTGEKLLKKLVADKENQFGQYNDMLLEDFEITADKKGQAIVNVISKPVDVFLQEALTAGFENNPFEPARNGGFLTNEADSDADLPPYVLPVINRNAVIIKPKAPFLDWLRKIYFPEESPQLYNEQNIYLLPEYDTEKESSNYIKKNFDRIFCNELWGWDTDEKKWPANRTYKMFTEWFEVKPQRMLYDMANYPLEKE